jgi:hypothetical protein
MKRRKKKAFFFFLFCFAKKKRKMELSDFTPCAPQQAEIPFYFTLHGKYFHSYDNSFKDTFERATLFELKEGKIFVHGGTKEKRYFAGCGFIIDINTGFIINTIFSYYLCANPMLRFIPTTSATNEIKIVAEFITIRPVLK